MADDTFIYTVADEWGQRTASVFITIEGGTVIFVKANDDPATTLPGTDVIIPVLDNDNASTSLGSLVIEPGSVSPPSPSGTASITTDNQIHYRPAPGASGLEATFTYRAKPSTADTPTSTATVRVQVLPNPASSSFVRVFPFRIASAAPGDIDRPTNFKYSTNFYNVSAGRVLDLRGFRATHHNSVDGANIISFRINGGANSVATGGMTFSTNPTYLAMPWAEAYNHPQWGNQAGVKIDDAVGDMALEGFDVRGTIDSFIPDANIGDGIRITFNGIHIVDCKNDAFQNNSERAITIKNAYIQSHTALSERRPLIGTPPPPLGNITVVTNCLFWQARQRYSGDEQWASGQYTGGASPGHPQSRKVERWVSPVNQNNENISDPKSQEGWAHRWFLKSDSLPSGFPAGFFRTRFDMRNTLIRIDTIPIEGTSVVFPPLGDGVGPGSVRGSYYENVVVLWMQGGTWPFPSVPAGITVITNTDEAYDLWRREQTAWYTANGYDSATASFAWTRRT